MDEVTTGIVLLLVVGALTSIIITMLKELFGIDIPGMFFKVESPSNVFAEIDPDESLSAAFKAALSAPAGVPDWVLCDERTQYIEDPLTGESVYKLGDKTFRFKNTYFQPLGNASTPMFFGGAPDSGPSLRGVQYNHRVHCQFCRQPGEPMTVCEHCGGRTS
jgi:hypothetical protein